MKTKIINLLLKLKKIFSNCCTTFKGKVFESYEKCKNGDEKLKNILLYWSFLPCILYLYLSYKIHFPHFILTLINIFILFLTLLDFYFIQKAIKVHPEYDSEITEELRKAEQYSTLTKEEYEKAVKTDNFDKKKNFIKRIFNIGGSANKIDFYKIVRIFVILTFLVALKRVVL